MSRILRRPMFRGGRVDSRGTGITSGLGYAKGGSVNTPKRGLVDGPGGYAGKDPFSQFIDPYFDRFNKWIGNVHPEGYVPEPIPQRNFLEDMSWLVGPGKFLKMGGYFPTGISAIRQMGKYPKFPPGYKSGKLDKYVDPKFLSNEWYMSKIRPYLSGAKETLSGAGSKIKEFGTTGAIGTAGGGWGLAKLYEMWKNKETLQEVKKETGDPEIDPEIAALNDQIKELEQLLLEQAQVKKDKTLSKEEKIAKIKDNEEMFREVYGSGRGEDATNMLLNFAGKALKEGATTKSAFGEFFEEESKRPSERKKYKDAAATAAINAFLTGEKTLAEAEAYMNRTDYSLRKQAEYKKLANDPSSLDWTDRRTYYMTSIKGNNRDSGKVIRMSLQDEESEKGKQIFETKDTEWITNPTEAAEMDDGLYIVTPKKGPKRIFEIKEGIVIDRSSDFPL